MPITVIVRSKTGDETARLTFDAAARVVIGRGAGSDVRLPDPAVSHRHATLRLQGTDFAVVDEGSTNGTFVGGVRVAPRTSRILRSGSTVRVGHVALEVLIDQNPVTRDLAMATRDLALALVSQAMNEIGADPTTRVRVVEGRDQGAVLPLAEEGRECTIGRGAGCDLPLADADASREHMRVVLRDGQVYVRDLGTKNGTWLGEVALAGDRETLWRSHQMIRIGRTVLGLEEPVSEALARIETAADENMPEAASPPPAAGANAPTGAEKAAPVLSEEGERALLANGGGRSEPAKPKRAANDGAGWSIADGLVMTAALVILVLSLAGMVWLLRG
jgi:pSer/pThr/pTyr-binding forkhead associated (FHA) protein